MKLSELRASRQWYEEQQKNDLRLMAAWVSGKDLPEYASTQSMYDMEVEVASLFNRLDGVRAPALTQEKLESLLHLVIEKGKARRKKLEGKWPQWAVSFFSARSCYVYGIIVLMMLRKWLPVTIPSRHLEVAIRLVSVDA